MKKNLVVLTGAGMSAESGISTFRDSGGLWEKYDITEVATPEAFAKNPKLVLDFYNQRRTQLKEAKPNKGHLMLAELEEYFRVQIITQNVDNLHERAGNKHILHLHGELTKVESTLNPSTVYDIGYKELNLGDTCEHGGQLRPHIVWFGEPVPAMDEAIEIVQQADYFAVIGTSLNVYPAAGLVAYCSKGVPKFIIDPAHVEIPYNMNFTVIQKGAEEGTQDLKELLLKQK